MEFNWLTINGKAGPATAPMLGKLGEPVRIRMVNLGMDYHPIHLHGNTFYVTGSEGGRITTSAWEPANTMLLGVAQARHRVRRDQPLRLDLALAWKVLIPGGLVNVVLVGALILLGVGLAFR